MDKNPETGNHRAEEGDIIEIIDHKGITERMIGQRAIVLEPRSYNTECLYFTIISEGEQKGRTDYTRWNTDYKILGRTPSIVTRTINKIKTMTSNITTAAKRFFSKELQSLLKAGFINQDLSLTTEGKDELQALLMKDNLTKFAELADEKIKEETK